MRVVLLMVVGALAASACGDRAPQEESGESSCPGCAIAVRDVHTIGTEDVQGSLTGRPFQITQDGQGRYWIDVVDAFPLLFDSAGKFLQQLGRRGEGPGEFRHLKIQSIVTGDSALVSTGFRFAVLGPDLSIGRQIDVDPRWEVNSVHVMSWPNNVLGLSSTFDQRTRISSTHLVRYDLSGPTATVLDTVFSVQAESSDSEAWASSLRSVGTPGTDGVWVANHNKYQLVQVTHDGAVKDTIVRQLDWFPGGEAMRIGGPGKPTSPHMMGNWTDSKGYLWVLASKPRTNTGDAWKDAQSGGMEVRVAALPAPYELNQTLIEVFDPVSRMVVAQHLFDGYLIGVLPNNRVASYVETEAGIPVITVHELSLSGQM